jgi:hypothetical protein
VVPVVAEHWIITKSTREIADRVTIYHHTGDVALASAFRSNGCEACAPCALLRT